MTLTVPTALAARRPPLLHIAQMVFDTPLMIIPGKLEVILGALGPRMATDPGALQQFLASGALKSGNFGDLDYFSHDLTNLTDLAAFDDEPLDQNSQKSSKPYSVTDSGIAIIPIKGVLMKKGSWMSAASGCSSYADLSSACSAAMDDPAVRGVLFDADSPGGTTHGCFECADSLHAYRGRKPMYAVANDLAASAAYALASSADRIFLTRTAGVGSVGVFSLHTEQSALDASIGVTYTYVFAGAHKVDGNPHQPLSKSALATVQAEVDRQYAIFTATVARNRKVSQQAVIDTKAEVWSEDRALPLLADAVGTYDDALAALTARLTSRISVSMALSAKSAMPAIPPHKTATSDRAWDGPVAKKRLREGESASYYRAAYAFARPSPADPATKAGYKFIHHEVSSSGDVGAANLTACSSSIAILNGGRSGTVLSGSDRSGTYRHVAAHIKDSGAKAPPLKAYRDYLTGVVAYATETSNTELLSAAQAALAAEPEGDLDMDAAELSAMIAAEVNKAVASAIPTIVSAVSAAKPKDDDDMDDDDEDDKDEDDEKDDESKDRKEAAREKKADDYGKKAIAAARASAADDAVAVAELCGLAGHTELLAGFLSDRKSVADVRKALHELRAKQSASTAIDASFGAISTEVLSTLTQQTDALIAASGGTMRRSDAMLRLLKRNPKLYDQYERERSAASHSPNWEQYAYHVQRQATAFDLSSEFGQFGPKEQIHAV